MKTNTTTAEKLLDAARQQKLSLPEVMLRREQEQNETPPPWRLPCPPLPDSRPPPR